AQSLDHATRLSDRFKACEKATDKLSDLVNDMLQISSLNWKENIVYTEEDIVAVTQNCVREFEDVAAMKKINLRLFLPQEAIQMKMDVSHIHTALGNLLKNAFHYTQAGGTVKVRLDRTGDEVSITVTDTGIGIEKENLTRVFDQFYRADNGMQANPEGAGLGLPFVKKVAEKHNGMVMVTSEITKGSSFTIRLPVHHNIQETQRPEQFRQEA
ncbi:MAG: HAMP domain-containing sensor histidine kinase, partial [Chloroflexota bacterium]